MPSREKSYKQSDANEAAMMLNVLSALLARPSVAQCFLISCVVGFLFCFTNSVIEASALMANLLPLRRFRHVRPVPRCQATMARPEHPVAADRAADDRAVFRPAFRRDNQPFDKPFCDPPCMHHQRQMCQQHLPTLRQGVKLRGSLLRDHREKPRKHVPGGTRTRNRRIKSPLLWSN